MEVAYEWLPDFCTHCQTIGHDVSACRWLYPRMDKNAHKETIVQGKKPVQTKKQNWVPINDNPSGIGSSMAYVAPQQTVAPIVVEVQNISHQQKETFEEPLHQLALESQNTSQQQKKTVEVPVQQSDIMDDDLVQGLDVHHNLGADTHNIKRSIVVNIEQDLNATTVDIPPTPTATVNCNLDVSQHSFGMALFNVTYNVYRSLVVTHEPSLTQVEPLDVNSIRADPGATLDPTLQFFSEFMHTWLQKVAVNEDVPFSPVLSKSWKKKMNKNKASYQTRSQGPFLNSQRISSFGTFGGSVTMIPEFLLVTCTV